MVSPYGICRKIIGFIFFCIDKGGSRDNDKGKLVDTNENASKPLDSMVKNGGEVVGGD